jgi:uncharacterized membrane protein
VERAQVKRYAKNFLKGHWGQALGVLALSVSVTLITAQLEDLARLLLDIPLVTEGGGLDTSPLSLALTAAQLVLRFLLTTPLALGITKWYWQLTGGEETRFGTVFEFYSAGFGGALSFIINLYLRCLAWAIVIFAPALAALALHAPQIRRLVGVSVPADVLGSISALSVLYIIGMFFLWAHICLRYFFAVYIYVSGDIGANAAIKKSVRLAKGRGGQLFGFVLSFAAWAVFGVLILPLLYLQPYWASSAAVYAHGVIYDGERVDRWPERQNAQDTQSFTVPKPVPEVPQNSC